MTARFIACTTASGLTPVVPIARSAESALSFAAREGFYRRVAEGRNRRAGAKDAPELVSQRLTIDGGQPSSDFDGVAVEREIDAGRFQ